MGTGLLADMMPKILRANGLDINEWDANTMEEVLHEIQNAEWLRTNRGSWHENVDSRILPHAPQKALLLTSM